MAIEGANHNIESETNEIIIPASAVEIQESPRVSIIASASPLIEVVAPATLAEGYTFHAQLGRSIFDVTVPPGGVNAGQRFLVPWPEFDSSTIRHSNIRVGRWKDGLCRCCKHGCCHAMLWNAFCFPLIAISQVMTRLKLSWLGKPSSSKKTFSIAVIITFFPLLSFAFDMYANPIPYFSFAVFTFYIINLLCTTAVTRRYMRDEYRIPSRCCGECEDLCCAIFCNCCVITQMARHTADYDTYAAYCCTNTGLSPHLNAEEHVMEPLL